MNAPHQPRLRQHGTRAAYVFGIEPGSDRIRGCRCPACTNANRSYQRARDRAARRPDVQPEPAYIDATEVRDHIRWLATQGMGLRTVASRARVSRSALVELRRGSRTRCTPLLADRVLAVGLHRAPAGCRIDAAPTWRLLEDMLTHGHTRSGIARLLGSQAKNPALQIGRSRVNAATARQVEELYYTVMHDVLEKRARNLATQHASRARRTASGEKNSPDTSLTRAR